MTYSMMKVKASIAETLSEMSRSAKAKDVKSAVENFRKLVENLEKIEQKEAEEQAEFNRIKEAELLSELPNEIDIEDITEDEALDILNGKTNKKKTTKKTAKK